MERWTILWPHLTPVVEAGIRAQNQAVIVGFRSAYVFDISQTDGEALPELTSKVTGDVASTGSG